MEFIIYTGNLQTITLKADSGNVYKLTKGVPHPVRDNSDKNSLINYTEKRANGGCKCKGETIVRPITSDEYFAKYQKMDIVSYRDKWAKHYRLNNPSLLKEYGLQ